MGSETTHLQVKLSLTVGRDPATDVYAAWCDELAVATSAPTMDEAKDALVSALRLAAEYALSNARSATSEMFAQVPYAEAVASRGDEELKALIHVHV